jgi:hypothetical protein
VAPVLVTTDWELLEVAAPRQPSSSSKRSPDERRLRHTRAFGTVPARHPGPRSPAAPRSRMSRRMRCRGKYPSWMRRSSGLRSYCRTGASVARMSAVYGMSVPAVQRRRDIRERPCAPPQMQPSRRRHIISEILLARHNPLLPHSLRRPNHWATILLARIDETRSAANRGREKRGRV